MAGFFGGLSKMFGDASLGDFGSLISAGASLAQAFMQPEAPQEPAFDFVQPPGTKPIGEDVADDTNERRRRMRQNTRAKKKVSQLSEQDIKATSLV